jgi:hypothetical protein
VVEVRCVDGSVLELRPVPVRARDDIAYEVTLLLLRDGEPFAQVGERCGWFVASAVTRLRAAVTTGTLPTTALEAGVRRWAGRTGADADLTWSGLDPYLPRDRELLWLRARDPDDVATAGELRVEVRRSRSWRRDPGRWEVVDDAVLDAWGDGGTGVRAVLGAPELLDVLEALVREVAAVSGSVPATPA